MAADNCDALKLVMSTGKSCANTAPVRSKGSASAAPRLEVLFRNCRRFKLVFNVLTSMPLFENVLSQTVCHDVYTALPVRRATRGGAVLFVPESEHWVDARGAPGGPVDGSERDGGENDRCEKQRRRVSRFDPVERARKKAGKQDRAH